MGKNIEIAILGLILMSFMAALSHWAGRSTFISQKTNPASIELDATQSLHSPELGN